ncbi:hypothetical protein SARC_07043 [Sphaeroforma arctica JP610]|uniref:MYND-type domain-containing protein n=1 Tax=Sphaeroforma arctica JP610 TaxID=667725 RepID=A0A0L0FVE6_9EUKA|nr:hypothetical protein SARC_07043 [Sphaeroforma arctica JP610]KNC80589.1 hypothetical protein SARC_07043 [Sphaeroforma arctica JP610]|eukprot:XP_014154491.1 hypothetical protein SARC_07043 [Sphaeroforma arctica JP610]
MIHKHSSELRALNTILPTDCVPRDTFQNIQARAHTENSPRAQVELGDIFMYGLKGQERDASTAAYLYQKAATAGLPEAQTQMGMIMYQNISNAIAPGNPDAQSLTRPLPVERCQADAKLTSYLQYLWVYLNDAASQGYISYFAVTQTRNANIVNSGGSYEVPEILQTAFDKIGEEANQIFLEKAGEVNPLACFSKECPVLVENESMLKLCSKCRVAKYCSKTCQVQSWKAGHKLECLAPL